MAIVDIAIKLIQHSDPTTNWLIIFDSIFFNRIADENKKLLFSKLTSDQESNYQTLFCVHSERDAQMLKEAKNDRWVNATSIGDLTLHSFI
ncbi:MAG: hypothetical protein ACPGAE_05575 [Neptuniibacter sp.]